MRIKLDENLGTRCADLLREAGHVVATVPEQGLCGRSDEYLIGECRREERCLVTLDRHFGDPLLFEPSQYAGIALLRLPPRPTHQHLLGAVTTLLRGLEKAGIQRKLWVIQPGRLREYHPEENDE